jgi:hypothetical protein
MEASCISAKLSISNRLELIANGIYFHLEKLRFGGGSIPQVMFSALRTWYKAWAILCGDDWALRMCWYLDLH